VIPICTIPALDRGSESAHVRSRGGLWAGDEMNVPEVCLSEALKTAMPFEEAAKLTLECARNAVLSLDAYNQEYAANNRWRDSDVLNVPPMSSEDIERSARMIGRYYLVLLHRRGLVGL
jgi:hypothetical protein